MAHDHASCLKQDKKIKLVNCVTAVVQPFDENVILLIV